MKNNFHTVLTIREKYEIQSFEREVREIFEKYENIYLKKILRDDGREYGNHIEVSIYNEYRMQSPYFLLFLTNLILSEEAFLKISVEEKREKFEINYIFKNGHWRPFTDVENITYLIQNNQKLLKRERKY